MKGSVGTSKLNAQSRKSVASGLST